MSVTGFCTCSISCLRLIDVCRSPAATAESGLIVSKPGMPLGVKPVAGSWSACAMLSMIARRSIASAIARR